MSSYKRIVHLAEKAVFFGLTRRNKLVAGEQLHESLLNLKSALEQLADKEQEDIDRAFLAAPQAKEEEQYDGS